MRLIGLCVIPVTLLAISSGIGQEPQKNDKTKAEPSTKVWLVGKWKHSKDEGVTISFGKDGKGDYIAVRSVPNRPGLLSTRGIPFDYEIDVKTNVVKMYPDEKDKTIMGTAERIADDKLRVNADWIENTVDFERIKEEKPKK
jgi:hypothetical protein